MADADSVNKIHFHSVQQKLPLKQRTVLRRFISSIFKAEKKRLRELNVVFCSDEYLYNINRHYLKHNTYTDIITFDLTGELPGITGEIYISLDRIRENAVKYRTSINDELHRVVFHGILHLCGYKDKSSAEKKSMKSKEDFYLKKYSLYVSRETGST